MKWAILAGVVAILVYLLRGGSASGQQVSSNIAGFQPTQLGAPQEVINGLSGVQLSEDVMWWIDPSTGLQILNTPNLLGSVPLVALTNEAQMVKFASLNSKAMADLDTNSITNNVLVF